MSAASVGADSGASYPKDTNSWSGVNANERLTAGESLKMGEGIFVIDLAERFSHLSRPPIVEATIHWQARATADLDVAGLSATLRRTLPQYVALGPVHQFEATLSHNDAGEPVVQHSKGWQGIRLRSKDQRYAVQFLRNGLVFSRTIGYENWTAFMESAKEVWAAFVEIAAPLEIERLGVRFINHFATATPGSVDEFLEEPPTQPSNLPLKEFVYQSTFAVPGHPFGIRVIKVMQPPAANLQRSSGLFVDIDVFSTKVIPNESLALDESLAKMRWLKNKVFFTLLRPDALHAFT